MASLLSRAVLHDFAGVRGAEHQDHGPHQIDVGRRDGGRVTTVDIDEEIAEPA
ncbi:hypothetical protein [Nonomuraea sp. SYSU D8015]|uniref:hypothetical protein n=1 Tax=Nonomuraea sp. SYSU D8015 TaxID=2593644 RepID=UPI001661849E|nr:hypothetical protein [Nonomuraea sp. SYSU D8015]